MSIEQPDQIDFVGIDNESGDCVLTISDHLDWANPAAHLAALQKKLNVYLHFIETGQLGEAYPDSDGRAVAILIVAKFPIPAEGARFLDNARSTLSADAIRLEARHIPDA